MFIAKNRKKLKLNATNTPKEANGVDNAESNLVIF